MNAILDTCALLDVMLVGYQPPVEGPWGASAISWCEIAWKNKLGKLNLGPNRDDFFKDLQIAGVHPISIEHDLTLAAVDLNWAHRDPADRLIVALAIERQLPLITRDEHVQGFYRNCLW